jgi:hypothetical protein
MRINATTLFASFPSNSLSCFPEDAAHTRCEIELCSSAALRNRGQMDGWAGFDLPLRMAAQVIRDIHSFNFLAIGGRLLDLPDH